MQVKPFSVAIWTSRIQDGINVNHKYFKQPSYNLGISAATIYEGKQLLELAISQGNLQQVLLGLDYSMFSRQKNMKKFQIILILQNIFLA